MATYAKPQKINECREKITQIVEGYYEEKENIIPNSGQLKFLKSLMIRHLAVSTNEKGAKGGLGKYLKERILNDKEDVLSFFDREKNIEAFKQSIYCDDPYFLDNSKVEYGFPPFLLLDKAHIEMERAFLEYLYAEKNTDNKTDWKDEEEEFSYKSRKYMEFLYSVTIFEIFLREYYAKVNENLLQNENSLSMQEKADRINHYKEMYDGCKDEKKKKELAIEMANYINTCMEGYCEIGFYCAQVKYVVSLQNHLYAMLRIVVLIEFLSINITTTYKMDEWEYAFPEAVIWNHLIENMNMDGALDWRLYLNLQGEVGKEDQNSDPESNDSLDLFGVEPVKPKKNLRTLYGELVNFYMKNSIYNHLEENVKNVMCNDLEDKKKKEKFENLKDDTNKIAVDYLNDEVAQNKVKEEYEEVEAFCKTFVLLHKYFERLNGYEKFHDYKNPELRDYQEDMQRFVYDFSWPIWLTVREIIQIQDNTNAKRREKAKSINREHNDNFGKK